MSMRLALAVHLTTDERNIMRLVAEGCSNRQIASRLSKAHQTVKNQLSQLYIKLGLSTRLELAVFAMAHQVDPVRRDSPHNIASTSVRRQ